jgi:hypothetical protein
MCLAATSLLIVAEATVRYVLNGGVPLLAPIALGSCVAFVCFVVVAALLARAPLSVLFAQVIEVVLESVTLPAMACFWQRRPPWPSRRPEGT